MLKVGDKLTDGGRDMSIVGVAKDSAYRTRCKYHCNTCGSEIWNSEYSLRVKKCKCRGCNRDKKVIMGEYGQVDEDTNIIWNKARWMVDLGVSEEDSKKYSCHSSRIITVKCPKCKKTKETKISHIYDYKSITCGCNGKSSSYPEKVVYNILFDIGVDFIFQASKKDLNWCNKKRYDFYIPSLNMIIETHGLQHYKDMGKAFSKSLQQQQEEDKFKMELAFKNGIKEYITIDCSVSDINFIKPNILNSKLSKFYRLNGLNWDKYSNITDSIII